MVKYPTVVKKYGTSLMITIPRDINKVLNVEQGSIVNVSIELREPSTVKVLEEFE